MKILILSLIFSPDNVSTAQIWSGIAEDLARAGHDLCVITTTPHFNRDESLEANHQLRPFLGKLIQKSALGNIPVYHILMPSKHIWMPLRLLSWISFHLLSTLVGWCLKFKPDVIIAPSPPLTIGLSAWAIGLVRRAQYIYNVQEIYPDIAVNLGMMKNSRIINFFKWMERFIYQKSMAVTSITPAMCAKIKARVAPEKVHHIPNFVDLSDIKEVPRDNTFAKTYDLQDRFVVTYAGNMGVPQNLGILVELAKVLPEITVLFVGDGGDAARLKSIAQDVPNVRFVPYQPLSRMPEIYACSDLFYVGQDPKACSDGIPSKIYRILGYRKPLLILTSPNSDLAQFVATTKSGILLRSDTSQAAMQLRTLIAQSETLKQMGQDGYDYVSSVFARPFISQEYETLCKQALETRP